MQARCMLGIVLLATLLASGEPVAAQQPAQTPMSGRGDIEF